MRYFFLLTILLMTAGGLQAQRRTPKRANATSSQAKYRHIQGIKGADLSYGLTQNGDNYKLGGFFYLANNSWVKTNVIYGRETVFNASIQRYGIDVLYGYTPFNLAGILFLNTQGGIGTFFDTSSIADELDVKNTINAGPVINLEPEWFFLQNSSIFIFYDQRLMIKQSFGRWRYSYGVGVRFSFR